MTTNESQTIEDLLAAIALPDGETNTRLHERLVEQAERDDLLDVSYRTIDSPFGQLLLAATPQGLVRVAFDREGHDEVLARLSTTISPRILRAPRRLDTAATQLDDYFAGRRHDFDVPIDLHSPMGFAALCSCACARSPMAQPRVTRVSRWLPAVPPRHAQWAARARPTPCR